MSTKTGSKKPKTAREKSALVLQFLNLTQDDTTPNSRPLSVEEERLLDAMAAGRLAEADVSGCEALLLGNRVALEYMAARLRGDAAPAGSPRISRDAVS